jgi:hypothetical protein
VCDSYVRRRNRELGVPEPMNGQPDYGRDGRWRAFDPYERERGKNTTGVVVDSGVLNAAIESGTGAVAARSSDFRSNPSR